MSTERDPSPITKKELFNFIYFGSIILAGIFYIQTIKIELEVLKSEMSSMKEMVKELHEYHLENNRKTSFNCYGHQGFDFLKTNISQNFNDKNESNSGNSNKEKVKHNLVLFIDKKRQISLNDKEER